MNHWILDSGASMHFTPRRDAFTTYQKFSKEERLPVQMAASTIFVEGNGTIRLRWIDNHKRSHDMELHDVGHIPNFGVNLISLRHLLQAGAKVTGETNTITVTYGDGDILVPFTTGLLCQNMYTLKVSSIHSCALGTIDYQTIHHHLGHPSKEVAKQAKQHTSGLLDFTIPDDSTVYSGCAKGKQSQQSFPPTSVCAKCAFEVIHTDVKSFSTDSYHKYKYLIIFLDDFTSMAWTIPLCVKSGALTATRQFLQMVKTQFQVSVQGWMLDFGGEYKSATYDDLLKGKGIRIYNSAPHIPQQNGHAERFMCTLMDKAEAMCHLACLPDSWWEFTTTHATHIYNRTPLSCLQWCTPYKALHNKQPQVNHLCVFGCAAYVFLPADVWADKLAPKLELMVYLGWHHAMTPFFYSCVPPTTSSSSLCKLSFWKRNSLNMTDLSNGPT